MVFINNKALLSFNKKEIEYIAKVKLTSLIEFLINAKQRYNKFRFSDK